MTIHDTGDERDRSWTRLELPKGHYGLPSFRFLDPVTHEPLTTDLGLRYARPEMLALSNLLRNPVIRPDSMDALVEGRRIKRSNKDLGRVLAIARLSGDDEIPAWPQTSAPVTSQQLRFTGERLMQDAVEPLRHAALASTRTERRR